MRTKNLTLGRGELHFGRFKTGTRDPRGERYLGNSPEFNVTLEGESLDHFNSDRGIREKDESILLQVNRTGSLTLDDIQAENLAMLFLGESSTLTDAGGAVVGESHSDVEQGLTYQLGTSATNPTGARKVSLVTVKDDEAAPTTYVVGDDYTVDADLGRVYIVEGGGIAAGTNLVIDYTVGAHTRDLIVSKGEVVEGSLRYIAYNPAGKQYDYYMPWVKLTPNGDFSLKAEQDWQILPFTVEIVKKENLEAIYIDGRPLVA